MAANQARLKRLSQLFFMLAALSILPFSVVLHAGKGGNWALPAFVSIVAALATVALVLGIRAQRTPSP
jgi:hypothetical protein